jgi:hypothetical protein
MTRIGRPKAASTITDGVRGPADQQPANVVHPVPARTTAARVAWTGMSSNLIVDRLIGALNSHDLDAVSSCFGEDFSAEWPAHPGRDFRGPEQVRRNWEMIFKMSPEITIAMTNAVEIGDEVWGEWHYSKAAGQGLRGVIIITVRGGLVRRSRFYMEPIDAADAAVPGGPRLARD